MIHPCPNPSCAKNELAPDLSFGVIRKGYYFRKSDSRKVPRYRCRRCNTAFSSATQSRKRYQKVRRITPQLRALLVSGVSQRRAAWILGVDRKTVIRRFRFLAEEARLEQAAWRLEMQQQKIDHLQFDDLETSEHTKCKPLSVALAVEAGSRKILSFQVSQMPAKGKLAAISRKKYGPRRDERTQGWEQLFREITPLIAPSAWVTSDDNPHYPRFVKKHLPYSRHRRVLGGRGAITGQGELKKKRFDPLFSLNHTCAMLRANLNRLFRRTWCTTKNRQGLIDHLSLYVSFHNEKLVRAGAFLGAS